MLVDPKSGRELFKPEINRNVAVKNRPASSRMVTDNLHMKHKMILEKRQKAADKEISLIKQQRKKFSRANKTSDRIVQ